MTTDTVPANAAGLPEFTLPPLPEAPDAHQLWSLHQAVHTIADVVDGLMSQPRFAAQDRLAHFNAAGDALATISEGLMEYAEQLVAMARVLPAGDGSRDDYRARLLLDYELAMIEDVASLGEKVAALAEAVAS